MLNALVSCNNITGKRTRQNIDVCMLCSSVAFGWFSGALTNETKSVRYKY